MLTRPRPPLTVLNVEIKTAAVEIKTLTVSGKQVTLAVFRQLPEVQLVNPDGTLNGTPWGSVNYHPDNCADYGGSHFHVVWQRGTYLMRSLVWLDYDDAVTQYDRNGNVLPLSTKPNREGYLDAVDALGCLPQLYIAV
jgi:hypothetical protein